MARPGKRATGLGALPSLPGLDLRFVLPRVLLILGVTVWIYAPCLRGDFIWDDLGYISTNPLMHGAAGLWKYWFVPGSWREYYPIEETVQWLEWQLWGANTLGYHLVNVLLHTVSALLVWRLLAKFGLKWAWIGGLIFAIHPAQVMSVAWMTELKNTLSLPPFLLAMCAWIDFQNHGRHRDYLWALGLFLLAMLCKISVVMFPFVILLHAWWKRDRISARDLRLSIPFFALSLVLGLVNLHVAALYQAGHGMEAALPVGGLLSRIALAGISISFYLAKCFLPIEQLPVYPLWRIDPPTLIQFFPGPIIAAVLFALWIQRRIWGRNGLLGLGFFLIMLAPCPGILSAPANNFGWVMDQLVYIPLIGLIGLIVAGLGDVEAKLPFSARRPVAVVGGFLLALMAFSSHAYASWFINEEKLWTSTLQRLPDSWLAHYNFGCYLGARRRYGEAAEQLRAAIQLRPNAPGGHANLGVALEKSEQTQDAIDQFHQALRLDPKNPVSCLNLGELLAGRNDLPGAEALFRQGLKAAPNDEPLCNDLGNVLVRTGRAGEAVELFRQAVLHNPDASQLRYNFGNALTATGDLPDAVQQLEKCVALDPSFAPGHENLGTAYARSGRLPEAIQQLELALEYEPQLGPGHDNLGLALGQSGDLSGARRQFELALQINPRDPDARACLTKLEQFKPRQNSK